jgi:outer membrane protein TolC
MEAAGRKMHISGSRRPALPVALLLLTGCFQSPSVSPERAGRLVSRAPHLHEIEAADPLRETREQEALIELTLPKALQIALEGNVGRLKAREDLRLQLLSLKLTRHNYGPLLQPLSASWEQTGVGTDRGHARDRKNTREVSTGISQKLPMGGSIDLETASSGTERVGVDSYESSATTSLTLPLLRGAGRLAAAEELTQAERDYQYGLYSFDYDRDKFLIDIAESYLTLLLRQKQLLFLKQRAADAENLQHRAEALYRFGRAKRADILQAELQVTRSKNSLANAESQLRVARDAFKIDLGLDPGREIELAPFPLDGKSWEPPELPETIETVLARNPQWRIDHERFEDARRALELARNKSRSSLNLVADHAVKATDDEPFRDQHGGDPSWGFGLEMEIPIDQTEIRRNYQKAIVTYRQAQRDHQKKRDQLIQEVRSQYLLLRQAGLNVRTQAQAVEEARKAVGLNRFEYQRGRATNREVILSQDDLLASQQAHQQALVDLFLRILRWKRLLGMIEIDPEGKWLE